LVGGTRRPKALLMLWILLLPTGHPSLRSSAAILIGKIMKINSGFYAKLPPEITASRHY